MKRRGPTFFKPAKVAPKLWRDTLEIIDLSDDGRGIARRAGKAVFVRGALNGERVEARSENVSSRYDEAAVISVLEPASVRVQARCRHYDNCGGCQLQHLSAEAQQAHKDQRFAGLLSRLAHDVERTQAPIVGDSWHYRHRIRLHFSIHKRQLALGFRAAKSHRITEVPGCQVLRPALTTCLQQIYKHKSALLKLRSGMLMLAESDSGAVSAHLVLDRRPTQTVMAGFLSEFCMPVMGISAAGETLWTAEDQTKNLYPGQGWHFQPQDFSQVNPEINTAIVAQLSAWLAAQPEDNVVDAFSGLGNFSLALAASGAAITGIELDSAMVVRARENAQVWPKLQFIQGDLFSDAYRLPKNTTKLVLDPPRAGAAALCRTLADSRVERIVYVSCDPATLERDAGILLSAGYQLRETRWADMFPQSYHMELLCLFERAPV
ncbi:MAG: 23S rRNA (uracil1939-C5)-methyltransferase [Bermanella sp.]|jgi:23S rRNA (uracil1939-C5)-methyltransferase